MISNDFSLRTARQRVRHSHHAQRKFLGTRQKLFSVHTPKVESSSALLEAKIINHKPQTINSANDLSIPIQLARMARSGWPGRLCLRHCLRHSHPPIPLLTPRGNNPPHGTHCSGQWNRCLGGNSGREISAFLAVLFARSNQGTFPGIAEEWHNGMVPITLARFGRGC